MKKVTLVELGLVACVFFILGAFVPLAFWVGVHMVATIVALGALLFAKAVYMRFKNKPKLLGAPKCYKI